MTDISDWYKALPQLTKYWLSLTVGISLLARLNILSPMYLVLRPEDIFTKCQIWRPITAVLYYPLGLHFLVNCFFVYRYSLRLETDHFKRSPSDYFFLLIFNWLCCVIIGGIANFYFLMDPMVVSVVYVWSQLNKNTIVTFWFGTQFKAMYLPWALLAVNWIVTHSFMLSFVGIVVGHIYFFLKYKYPQEMGGPAYLETPVFLKQYFPDAVGAVHGFHVLIPENLRNAPPNVGLRNRIFGGNDWGRGQTLGRS